MQIITVYESHSTDGYTSFGDGKFFKKKSEADDYAFLRHGNYKCSPREHKAVLVPATNTFFLLKTDTPKEFYEDIIDQQEIARKKKEAILSKLSKEEREILGL